MLEGRRRLAVLCGGLGGARLALALKQVGLEDQTTFVTNVGDDWEVGGLLVCPDTDAVLYALGGQFDEDRGWGVKDDSFPGPQGGEPAWFSLGVRDRAHHQARTRALESGRSLGEVVGDLALKLGVRATVVPVTDDRVPTVVDAEGGSLLFQEWLVREHAPRADAVHWPAASTATPSPLALSAIETSQLVVVASSSPVASIGSMLALPGIREALQSRRGPTVALSPVVMGRPPTTDRDRGRGNARAQLMRARGLSHDPVSVVRAYGDFLTHFVLDPADESLREDVAAAGVAPLVAPLLDQDVSSRARLVEVIVGQFEHD